MTSSDAAVRTPQATFFDVDGDEEDVNEFIYQQGWGDGLPVVAPTEHRVDALLNANGLDPDEVIGPVPVSHRIADMRSVAINATMAGCRAEYLPALVALFRAVLEPGFNLAGLQATTHVGAPLAVFGGPIVEKLPINSGAGVLGPGTRANAVIGRALRLILINIGGGTIGEGDKATFGHPGKFTYVAAENAEANPWSSLREEDDVAPDQSAVTVYAAEAPHNVNDHGSRTAEGILVTVAGTLATLGNNNIYLGGQVLVVLGAEHAAICAREDMTKVDVRQRVFDLAQLRIGDVWWENRERFARIRPDPFATGSTEDPVPVVSGPDQVAVTVFGGSGRHSLVIPTFGASRSQTVRIEGGHA